MLTGTESASLPASDRPPQLALRLATVMANMTSDVTFVITVELSWMWYQHSP
jgi:hypothetical protein